MTKQKRTKTISLRISPEELAELDALCAELGTKRADTIIFLVQFYQTNSPLIRLVDENITLKDKYSVNPPKEE